MTALAGNISRPVRDGGVVRRPVAANARLRGGSLAEIDAAGRVTAAAKGVNKTYIGVALGEANNTGGAAGAINATLRRGVFHFAKSGTAVPGKKAYVVDDNTVTDAAGGASACGLILDADADGVWVELD